MASPNLTRQTLATNEIVDRLGVAAGGRCDNVSRNRSPLVNSRIRTLDFGTTGTLGHGAREASRGGRRPPGARASVEDTGRSRKLGAAGDDPHGRGARWAADEDPYVRRTAAEALGLHPQLANVTPLAALLREKMPRDDTHLIHVVRMARRNQLLDPQVAAALKVHLPQDNAALKTICEVARAAKSAAAADLFVGGGQRPERRCHRFERNRAAHGALTWGTIG